MTTRIQHDVIEMVLDAISDNRLTDMEVSEIHNEVFNTDYFIIGSRDAEQYLQEFGVFEAIHIVKRYELINYGECITDLSDPEKLVNMLVYVQGEELLNSLSVITDNWDEKLNSKLENELKIEIKNL